MIPKILSLYLLGHYVSFSEVLQSDPFPAVLPYLLECDLIWVSFGLVWSHTSGSQSLLQTVPWDHFLGSICSVRDWTWISCLQGKCLVTILSLWLYLLLRVWGYTHNSAQGIFLYSGITLGGLRESYRVLEIENMSIVFKTTAQPTVLSLPHPIYFLVPFFLKKL